MSVYKSFVEIAIICGSEAYYLKESKIKNFQKSDIHGESNIWRKAHRYENSYGFDADVEFESKDRLVVFGKQFVSA